MSRTLPTAPDWAFHMESLLVTDREVQEETQDNETTGYHQLLAKSTTQRDVKNVGTHQHSIVSVNSWIIETRLAMKTKNQET